MPRSLKMDQLLNKHALERLTMDVSHARAWYDFYMYYEPNETLASAWEKTLLYRIQLMNKAEELYAESTSAAASSADSTESTATS